jgi:FtsZ-binding cell division protein ZapB
LDLGGVKQIKKSFDLYTLGQAMVYKLKEHDVQLKEHDQAIKNLEAENEQMRSRIKALERLCGLQNNEFVEAKEFSF